MPITSRILSPIDFFTVPTAGLRVLFVLVVLAHHRRRVVHFNVTEHPTAHWTAQQIVDAFPDDSAPAYLLRDRDRVYGKQFRRRVKGMGIEEVVTAPRSPWQNPFAERLIGSIRRECLDHVIVLSERHLRRVLTGYFAYYHRARTHLSLAQGRTRRTAKSSPRDPAPAPSSRFPKSVACITATSATRRSRWDHSQESRTHEAHAVPVLAGRTFWASLEPEPCTLDSRDMADGSTRASPPPWAVTRAGALPTELDVAVYGSLDAHDLLGHGYGEGQPASVHARQECAAAASAPRAFMASPSSACCRRGNAA